MTRVLLKYGSIGCLVGIVLAALIAAAVDRTAGVIGALFGGTLAGLNFLGLIYLVGELLNSQTSSGQKASSGLLIMAKMTLVGLGFYMALVTWKLSAFGLAMGVGGAIFGLTLALNRATSSPEGRAAIKAESERIGREMNAEADDVED